MPTYWAAPTFLRVGVIAGFILDAGVGLVPKISGGVLFAQSTMFRSTTPPIPPAAPASQQSWLWWHTGTGWYWTSTPTPTDAADALAGWVVTDASHVVAWSSRRLGSGAEPVIVPGGPINVASITGSIDVPPEPFFGAGAGGGFARFNGFSFAGGSENISDISSGTLTMYSVDELAASPASLSADMSISDAEVYTTTLPGWAAGQLLQIEQEIVLVNSAIAANHFALTRAQKGSTAAAHATGKKVWAVDGRTASVHFPPEFFGGGDGWYDLEVAVPMTSRRVVAATLFMTNPVGNGPKHTEILTHNDDAGLRTLTGGQIDLVVDGVLAVQANASPAATVAAGTSIAGVYATVDQAPTGAAIKVDVRVDGAVIGTLTVAVGNTVSDGIGSPMADGSPLVVMPGKAITIDVTQVGSTYPGRRLVVIVQI